MTHQHTATATDGASIAWSSIGKGDPVVLVHGITESAASFAPITERLAATHRVITLDLRGHGESSSADTYDLASMVGDVASVVAAAGAAEPHLIGHSLGGAVVTAAGAVIPVRSVVDVDQSLQLDAFKDQLVAAEPMLRDPEQYTLVTGAMFEMMMGDMLSTEERDRVNTLRRPQHDVVLGVWELLLDEPVDVIARTIDEALAGYATSPTPYLALFGLDPGPDYPTWIGERIPGATVEYWTDHGHYPHLVDPERFVARVREFWT